MPKTDSLQFVIRSPQAVVLDALVESARVPTPTGQVGLRPRQEPLLLSLEPGLILYCVGAAVRFAATAGGLVEGERERAVVYTPFAVAAEDADEVLAALNEAIATPGSELALRRRLGELEERILGELRNRPASAPPRRAHG